MRFSDGVLTKSKKNKVEVRTLDSRGEYVLCKYLDINTLKPSDDKRKLCLKDKNGDIKEYFIIPLKTPNRALLVAAEKEKTERKIWNEKTRKEESLFE